jgi:hypothetical protein
MTAATKCEVEQCAPAGSPEPTARDNTPPQLSRKTRRRKWWKENGEQQNTAVQCCPCQTRLQMTAKKQPSGRLQTPPIKSGKATGGRKKQGKGRNAKPSQPVLRSGHGDQQEPVITRPQLSKHNTSPSRFSSRNQIIEAWRNASRQMLAEMGQQGLIEDFEIQADSPHVVDGIPGQVEKSSIDTRTGSTYSQSIGYPSTTDTPATEVSEGWSRSPGVLASVGGQFEEPALPQTSPFPWGMSKGHLDWINNEDLHNSISLVVQRAFTFPCSGKFHFEEGSVSASTFWLLNAINC